MKKELKDYLHLSLQQNKVSDPATEQKELTNK